VAEAKALNFSIECSLPAETVAVGDLKRIRQILVNLVGNAIKFTEKGAVGISVFKEKDGLALIVADTGRGISPERQKAVFDRFYQGQEPGSGKVQGSGLGLAIAKDLVQLMGGDIGVTSERGRGSTFKVWLPLWLDVEKAPETAPARAVRLEPNPAPARAYTVLVAEDHPINLKLAMALLQAAGCETDFAGNGQQALAKLEKSEYDLIVMDSQMPVMTGIEAIKAIRRRPDWKRATPILSLTADAMKGAEDYHAMAGADAYMSKPLKSDAFIEAVKRLSERGRALREKASCTLEAV
jgi:CheY-like chemotaxis protein/anti-sigma regulatory factor (Ser/Thr protein kinase)